MKTEAKGYFRLKKALKIQSLKRKNLMDSADENVLVRKEIIVNNFIGELIRPATVLHNRWSMIVAIHQNDANKRYS